MLCGARLLYLTSNLLAAYCHFLGVLRSPRKEHPWLTSTCSDVEARTSTHASNDFKNDGKLVALTGIWLAGFEEYSLIARQVRTLGFFQLGSEPG